MNDVDTQISGKFMRELYLQSFRFGRSVKWKQLIEISDQLSKIHQHDWFDWDSILRCYFPKCFGSTLALLSFLVQRMRPPPLYCLCNITYKLETATLVDTRSSTCRVSDRTITSGTWRVSQQFGSFFVWHFGFGIFIERNPLYHSKCLQVRIGSNGVSKLFRNECHTEPNFLERFKHGHCNH